MFPITILGLSDELLLAVLSFLSVKDILSVADVNKRLHDVASDLSLSRKGVNFSRCYEVTNDDVKSFFQLQSPKAVRVLNFNQCYWFKSKFIQNVLRKCNNVTEIDLRGCQVTAVLLSDILEKTKKLQTLGWSTEGNFNESKPCAETLKKLRKLWLSVHYCCRSLLGLCLNLELLHLDSTSETKCECRQSQRVHHYPNLKELIMFTRNVPCLPLLSSKQLTQMRRIAVPDDIYGHYFQYKSQSLQTLDVDVMRSVSNIRMGTPALRIFKELKWVRLACGFDVKLLSNLVSIIEMNCDLQGLSLVIDRRKPSFNFLTLEHNGGVLLASLIEKCHNLEYLNITCHCHLRRDQQIIIQEVADNIANNEKVTALSLPVCLLGSVHSEEKSLNKPRFTFNGVIRSTRVGMSTSCEAEPNKLLSNILKCCADLKEFSLISPSFVSELNGQRPVLCMESRALQDSDIALISRLNNLKKLSLIGLPGVLHGNSIVTIAIHCCQLTSLSLACIGTGSHAYLMALNQSFQHFKNLRDLRLEHNVNSVMLNHVFWTSLGQCKMLQRICIITKDISFDILGVYQLFDNCPKLTAFYLFCHSPLNTCKSVRKHILKSYGPRSQSLSVAVHPLTHDRLPDIIASIPDVHLKEIVKYNNHDVSCFLWKSALG